jgi:hypothetical protein
VFCPVIRTFGVGSEGGHVPTRLIIDNSKNGYLAMDAAVLVEAFEGTLNELGLVDRKDPVTLLVATHIIIFAKAGESDSERLRDLTVKAIQQERRRPQAVSPALIPTTRPARSR